MSDYLFWVSFMKNKEVAHILGSFFPRQRLCIKFAKNEQGYSLGDFFENESGHPACC
jgi:hypothetical protein